MIIALVWAAAVAVGVCLHAGAESSPSDGGGGPHVLPPIAALKTPPGVPLIAMALHPRCPCSPASVDELEALAGRSFQPVTVVVLVSTPAQDSEEWDEAFDRISGKLSSMRVIKDRAGAIAASLGMHASGATLIYDSAGRLVFSGGLTLARGMAGANPAAIEAMKRAGCSEAALPVDTHSPVFGCRLIEPGHREEVR